MIATAAHCAWNNEFATNVMFIPEQEGTSSSSANGDCTDDPHGCWFPSHAVIHDNYKSSWLLNDFAIYVINLDLSSSSSHQSSSGWDNRPMSDFICPFDVDFDQETLVSGSGFGTSYGYPGSSSPDMRFCQDGVNYPTPQGDNSLWLGSCTMGGGSSGGGWVPFNSFELFATNSFGYCANRSCKRMLDGMAATRCFGSDHICQCVLNTAKVANSNTAVTQTGCSLSPHINNLGAICTQAATSTTTTSTAPAGGTCSKVGDPCDTDADCPNCAGGCKGGGKKGKKCKA